MQEKAERDVLAKRGNEGWELVHVEMALGKPDTRRFYFKRAR